MQSQSYPISVNIYGYDLDEAYSYELVTMGALGEIDRCQVTENLPIEINGGSVRGFRLEKVRVVPEEFIVENNIPNPFNSQTEIRFELPEAARVCITVYDIRGQKVNTLINDHKPAGYHSVMWNGTNDSGQELVSGTYIYRVQAGHHTKIKKMVLLK